MKTQSTKVVGEISRIRDPQERLTTYAKEKERGKIVRVAQKAAHNKKTGTFQCP